MDGRSNRRNKVKFSNSSCVVWAVPNPNFNYCLRFVPCHSVKISFFLLVSSGAEESDSTSRAYFKTRRQRSDSLRVFSFTSLEKGGRCSELTTLYMGRKYGRFFCSFCFVFSSLFLLTSFDTDI